MEDIYGIEIDAELVNQDIDEIDLYAEKTVDDDSNYDDGGILYE